MKLAYTAINNEYKKVTGVISAENEQLQEAEADLKKALAMDKNLTAAYLNLGLLREKQERFEEALDLYKNAYDMDSFGSIGEKAARRYNALVE